MRTIVLTHIICAVFKTPVFETTASFLWVLHNQCMIEMLMRYLAAHDSHQFFRARYDGYVNSNYV
jgi:hypothetical protein